jgi:glycosyltransferase involved in cell wall biosynthesis
MRSLFIISLHGDYGGAERSMEIVADSLQQNVRLTVFASSSKQVAALQRILRPPSRVIRLRERRKALNEIIPAAQLLAYIAAFRPDAILTNTNHSAKVMAAVARLLPRISVRTFIYVRDFMWTDFDFDVVFKRLKEAHVIIPGPAVLDRPQYLARHLVPRGSMQWSIVENAVSLPRPAMTSGAFDGYVLHLAPAHLWKGHYPLIRAAALLRDRGVSMRFISRGSIGRPTFWSTLHGLVARLGLAKSFALWDWVEDPSELLRGSLCVVVPSISHFGGPETFGRAVIEAWAHGKPVVAFDAGGPHYLIEHEHDGLLVPEGNVEALADALHLLQQRPDLCRRLGENGLAKVRQSFTVDKVITKLRALLEV